MVPMLLVEWLRPVSCMRWVDSRDDLDLEVTFDALTFLLVFLPLTYTLEACNWCIYLPIYTNYSLKLSFYVISWSMTTLLESFRYSKTSCMEAIAFILSSSRIRDVLRRTFSSLTCKTSDSISFFARDSWFLICSYSLVTVVFDFSRSFIIFSISSLCLFSYSLPWFSRASHLVLSFFAWVKTCSYSSINFVIFPFNYYSLWILF